MIALPALPYAYDALQPVISALTMHTHHDKHHAKYVKTVNALTAESADGARALEDIVVAAVSAGDTKLANNAGQAWNHALSWISMTPSAGTPQGPLRAAIEADFGDLKRLGEAFVAEGGSHFGSGWVWLAADKDRLKVLTTHDGGTILGTGLVPLLMCDLWEHAYYLDHKNDRAGYLAGWWDRLANWSFAEAQYAAAQGSGEPWRYPS